MEDAIQLAKLKEHYYALLALMLESMGSNDYCLLDRELDAIEYQMDILTLRMDGFEE